MRSFFTKNTLILVIAPVLFSTGCTANQEADDVVITNASCLQMGGVVVGDIGDGRIHRPDYLCESGKPPFGPITHSGKEGEPIPIEGSVCCPQ